MQNNNNKETIRCSQDRQMRAAEEEEETEILYMQNVVWSKREVGDKERERERQERPDAQGNNNNIPISNCSWLAKSLDCCRSGLKKLVGLVGKP